MKLNCNSSRYADFKTVANTFSTDIAHVFYACSGLHPTQIESVLVLYTSGARYVSAGIADGEVTETAFLLDFPSAVKAAVDANY